MPSEWRVMTPPRGNRDEPEEIERGSRQDCLDFLEHWESLNMSTDDMWMESRSVTLWKRRTRPTRKSRSNTTQET